MLPDVAGTSMILLDSSYAALACLVETLYVGVCDLHRKLPHIEDKCIALRLASSLQLPAFAAMVGASIAAVVRQLPC